MTLTSTPQQTTVVESALNEARKRIQVTQDELDEARRRRSLLAECLKREFGGRSYYNGSVAHGDALDPLTDVDLGIVIPDPDGQFGPGREGPARFQDRAARAIRRDLGAEFPRLRVEHLKRRRSVLVKFGDPVTAGQDDFTADVITAIDNDREQGLLIPNYDAWDPSDPVAHTDLITAANASSRATFARGVRLMKHWNRRHDHPVCSWNIKALALDWIDGPVSMTAFVERWLVHAIAELAIRDTPDPAGVAAPIETNWPRNQVVAEFAQARQLFARALEHEREGYPILALDALATFFADEDMMPAPDRDEVHRVTAERFAAKQRGGSASRAASSTTPIADRIHTRSWAFR